MVRMQGRPRFSAARLVIGIALTSQLAQGQYTGNFQTNTVSDVTNNWSGTYYVGESTRADALIIESNGDLNVSGPGFYIGWSVVSSNNYVLVTDPGSVLSNVNGLFIGYQGSANSLVISNGGRVYTYTTSDSENGVGWDGGRNNSVVVTGTGSLWSVIYGVIRVGGAGNSLVIRNGGQVWDSEGDVGFDSIGSNNSVLVTGSGSVWSNFFGLDVDGSGPGASLIITNNGQVFVPSGGAVVGYTFNSNLVRVVDGGLWQVDALTVGNLGSGNTVVVAGGSAVATNVVVGAASASCNNVLELDSGTVTVVDNGAGVLEVRDGELVLRGGELQADTLLITNPCAQFVHTGGTLIVSNVVLDPNLFQIVSIVVQTNGVMVTWLMGPGATNALQITSGDANGNYSTSGFTDVFVVTNNPTPGAVTNYLDVGAGTNGPARYYRARYAP